mmetsp:Transcript_32491/g.41645  ORF Transcript_32491/g.41645 Transcript_32491/m.41645 type:complete len:691 (-) Transcript_32491:230-2302(-)
MMDSSQQEAKDTAEQTLFTGGDEEEGADPQGGFLDTTPYTALDHMQAATTLARVTRLVPASSSARSLALSQAAPLGRFRSDTVPASQGRFSPPRRRQRSLQEARRVQRERERPQRYEWAAGAAARTPLSFTGPNTPSSTLDQAPQLIVRAHNGREEGGEPAVHDTRSTAVSTAAGRNRTGRPSRQRYSTQLVPTAETETDDCSPTPTPGNASTSESPVPIDVDHVFWWESGSSRSPTRQARGSTFLASNREDVQEDQEEKGESEEEKEPQPTLSSRTSRGPIREVWGHSQSSAASISGITWEEPGDSEGERPRAMGRMRRRSGLQRQRAEYPLVQLEELQEQQRHQEIMQELHLGFQALGLSNRESMHLLSIAESLGLSSTERATYLGYSPPNLDGAAATATEEEEEEEEEEIREDVQRSAGTESESGESDIIRSFGLESLVWDGVIQSGLAREMFEAGIVEFDPFGGARSGASLGDAWTLIANLLMQWVDAYQVLDQFEANFTASLGLQLEEEGKVSPAPEEGEEMANPMPAESWELLEDAQSQIERLSQALPATEELQPFVEAATTLSRHEALVLKALLIMKEEQCQQRKGGGHVQLCLEIYPLLQKFYSKVRPKWLEYIDQELKFIIGGTAGLVSKYFQRSKQQYLQHYWQTKKNLSSSMVLFPCSSDEPPSENIAFVCMDHKFLEC